jgi:proteasome lid subunit RPN8/RPN11
MLHLISEIMGKKRKNKRYKMSQIKQRQQSIRVVIPDEVYQKVMYWVQKAPGECSGFGKVVFDDGVYTVKSAMLVKQVNTGADTEIDGEELAKALFETKDQPGELNWWWHSHVNMECFWSDTDREAIESIGSNGYCIATVFNKKVERLTAFYRKADGSMPPIFVNHVPTTIARTLPEELTKAWDAEYDAKCKPKSYPAYTGNYPYGGGGMYGKKYWEEKDLTEVFDNFWEDLDLADYVDVKARASWSAVLEYILTPAEVVKAKALTPDIRWNGYTAWFYIKSLPLDGQMEIDQRISKHLAAMRGKELNQRPPENKTPNLVHDQRALLPVTH